MAERCKVVGMRVLWHKNGMFQLKNQNQEIELCQYQGMESDLYHLKGDDPNTFVARAIGALDNHVYADSREQWRLEQEAKGEPLFGEGGWL